MGERLPYGDLPFSVGGELGPVVSRGPVKVQQSVLDQQGDDEGGHAFGTGVGARDRILRQVGSAAKVHHFGARTVDGDLGAVQRVVPEERIKQVPDRLEFGRGKTGRKWHGTTLAACG
ncbi:hypothetical protein D9M72_573650 [compost metagenome]